MRGKGKPNFVQAEDGPEPSGTYGGSRGRRRGGTRRGRRGGGSLGRPAAGGGPPRRARPSAPAAAAPCCLLGSNVLLLLPGGPLGGRHGTFLLAEIQQIVILFFIGVQIVILVACTVGPTGKRISATEKKTDHDHCIGGSENNFVVLSLTQ